MNDTPTMTLARALDTAFHHFNAELFDGELPTCLITTQRKKGAHGYFWAEIFKSTDKDSDARLDEISLNPESFDRSPKEILSTLVHEMVHHWQRHFCKPGKNGYHNKRWCKKMIELGLEPVSAKGKGLKATGKKVSHEIVDHGPFCESFHRLEESARRFDWAMHVPLTIVAKPTRKKFECEECGQGVWGTAKNNLICGDCNAPMTSEEDDDA